MGPALVSAGASILGGYLGNRAARQEAARNRQFQERMRNTQWQAAVADMEAAGLNPALAYSQGGAASPGGSMASQEDYLSKGVGSAMQATRLRADVKNLQAQYGLIKSQTLKESTTAQLLAAQAESAKAKAQLDKFRTTWLLDQPEIGLGFQAQRQDPMFLEQLQSELDLLINRAQREGATARSMEPIARLADELGIWLPVMAMGGGVAGGVAGVASKGWKALKGAKMRRDARRIIANAARRKR